MDVCVVEALPRHCRELAEAMDEEGRELIRKGWGVEPVDGLMEAYRTSWLCCTVLIDGGVAALFGCAGEIGGVGHPWLTTAPAMARARLRFIRQSGPYLEEMCKRHTSLQSWAHQDNLPLLRWLEWAGFDIVGKEGELLCVCRRC